MVCLQVSIGLIVSFPVRAQTCIPLSYATVVRDAVCGSGNSGSILVNVSSGGRPPFTYSWNTTPVQTAPLATNLAPGLYNCVIEDASGCITVVQEEVKRRSTVVLRPTARPNDVCPGETVALSVVAAGGTLVSYTWNPGNIPGTNITVTPVVTTNYTISGQDAFGCAVEGSVPVTVRQPAVAGFTVTPATVCQGMPQTVTFTGRASGAAVYNWNGFAGAAVQSGNGAGPYAIVFSTPGTKTIQLQVTDNGCNPGFDSKTVEVVAPPVVDFTLDKTTICAGDSVAVQFTGNVSNTTVVNWNWGGGGVQGSTRLCPFKIKYNNNALIVCTANDGVCAPVSKSASVAVVPLPKAAYTTAAITGCAPVAIQFTNQSKQADVYEWMFGDGEKATVEHPVHTYKAPGQYAVRLVATSQAMCTDTVTNPDLISVLPKPVAGFQSTPGANTPVELSAAGFQFNNSSQHARLFSWLFSDGETATATDPQHRYNLPGNYEVTLYVRNDIGCVDSITRGAYVVIADKELKIPNAFSPNGDGVHDRWEIPGLRAYPGSQVTVYNRYGQTVFSSRGYTMPWDGNAHGKAAPEGTYYYVIKSSRDNELFTGWVELLR